MTDFPLPDPPDDGPVDEPAAVVAAGERIRRFRNDTDASIQWNGHTLAPHEDVEILLPADPLVLAAGLTETTLTARFVQPAVAETIEHEQDETAATPAAQAAADEAGVDVADVTGTGVDDRVLVADVADHVAALEPPTA